MNVQEQFEKCGLVNKQRRSLVVRRKRMEGEISEVKRVLEENSSCDSYLEQLEAVTWPIGFDKLTHCNSLIIVVDAGWGPGTLHE